MEAHAVCKTSVQETIKRYAKVFFFFCKALYRFKTITFSFSLTSSPKETYRLNPISTLIVIADTENSSSN